MLEMIINSEAYPFDPDEALNPRDYSDLNTELMRMCSILENGLGEEITLTLRRHPGYELLLSNGDVCGTADTVSEAIEQAKCIYYRQKDPYIRVAKGNDSDDTVCIIFEDQVFYPKQD